MTTNLIIEIFAVITSLIFLILLIKQNIWCWVFGIISSIASIYLFIQAKLYSEAILYFYYVAIGIYGWIVWKRPQSGILAIKIKGRFYHVIVLLIGISLSLMMGLLFRMYTDAARSFADAFSTIFSFIASYLEVHRILSAWLFWIIINLFSVWLYFDRGLLIYSALMLVYFIVSVYGYLQWKKEFKNIS